MTTHYDLCIIDRSLIYSQCSKSIDGLKDRRQNNNKNRIKLINPSNLICEHRNCIYKKIYMYNEKLHFDWFEIFKKNNVYVISTYEVALRI